MKSYFNLFLISLIFSVLSVTTMYSQGTASLAVISMAGYPDTAYEAQVYTFNILLRNNTNLPISNTTIYINLRVDSTIAIIDSLVQPNLVPGDSVLLTLTGYGFNPNQYKAGNNIVVVWPIVNASPALLIDTFYTNVFFVPLNAINDPLINSQLTLYPVPAQFDLHLSFPNFVRAEYVRIYDSKGRLILENLNVENGIIDISKYKPGIYFIEAFADRRFYHARFLRQ